MAEKKMSKIAEQDLEKMFSTIDMSSKSDLFARVSAINAERDKEINKRATELASDAYLQKHFKNYIPGTPDSKKTFIEGLSLEQKLDIIGEYTNEQQIFEGNQGVLVKLQDIAKRKAENKLRYKEEALEIIKMYEKGLTENRAKIQTLEADIEKTKANIASAETKLQEIIGKDDEALAYAGRQSSKFDKDKAIEAMKKNIEELRRKLASQEKLLGELKGIQAKFEVEFNKRKSEIETELQSQNIFLYDRKGSMGDKPETSSEKNEQEDDSKNKTETSDTGAKMERPEDKKIAKTMMDDFFNLAPEEQRKLLDRMDNQGILDMARNLGSVNRAKFNIILNARLDELGENEVTFNGIQISKDELKDMKHMSAAKLRAIRQELDEFNSDFTQKSIDEIEEFENKLQYVRIGALLAETGAFKGIARKFMDGFSSQRNSIFELSKSFARYAEIKGKRVEEKEGWKDSLRAAVGRKPMNELAKDGTRKLNRDVNRKGRLENSGEER